MAELTFKSAGVGTREIDLSGPTSVTPTGTPAGVIGTANRGPAFVPVTVANYQQFTSVFGDANGQFGPLAMYEWLKNANAGTYLRVLGVGDGRTRAVGGINAGRVNNAGYVVGNQLVQDSGDLGNNGYALGPYKGRTMFLGCFMSESLGSTYFTEAGVQTSVSAVPIIRGVIMTPSGVIATLSSSAGTGYSNVLPATSAPSPNLVGYFTGTMDLTNGKQEFVLFLSGHKANDAFGNIITASFDPQAPNYFATLFNTDPLKTEEAGHYLYAAYDVYSQYAVPTGSDLTSLGGWAADSSKQDIAFVLTSSLSQNSGSTIVPNYEGFEDRFRTAFSPGVISQRFGDPVGVELFKIHALDDGVYANTKVKVSIRNITPSTDPTSEYGTFDLFVRDFNDSDDAQIVLESFVGLSMDPSNQRFIGKMIGDLHTYYDFDRQVGSQKLVSEGSYPSVSNYIRVSLPETVISQEVPASALPHGFKGMWHLVTSGSSFLAPVGRNTDKITGARQPPVPMRRKIAVGTGNSTRVAGYLHWGTQFEANDSTLEPNKNQYFDNNIPSHVKYFPHYHTDFANAWVGDNTGTPDANGTIYDADVFNRNSFTLENVQVITASNGLPDPNLWTSASYVRDGSTLTTGYRFLKTTDLTDSTSRRFAKFTFPLQGGFDGVNIFDPNKSTLNDTAAVREMLFSTTQFGPNGSTVASYRKALDILGEVADVDVQLLAIPGIREPGVTDYAIDTVENRFDALYVMDVQQLDVNGNVITGSTDIPSVTLTANRFANRVLDTSFGAAYYPDLVLTDPGTGANLVVPPTVAVLGAFSLNDRVAYPWFAPAGFTRGALSDVVEAQVKLSRTNLDTLYSANVNPITTVPGSVAPVVYGQKTILARASALDRVNVRRLLIEIRRRVRSVANTILFEPNRESTLNRFSSLVDPILKQIQAQQGVDRYKVKIDTTTTTQADVENNTIRGKIFIQPTRSIEFVSLDFVVTNAGAQI